MKRNLVIAILTPCILACILVILIVLDNRDSAQKTNQPDTGNGTVVSTITPTVSATAIPTSMPETTESTPAPTSAANPTPSKTPTASPTQAPTASPTTAPTAAPTSAPTTEPTPTPVSSPDTALASPTPTPLEETSGDITGAPQEPGQSAGTTEPGQDHPDDKIEPGQNPESYHALYTSKGEDYTLVADSITSSYLLINNQDLTIRKTAFKYAPYFKETPGNFFGPILGYKNKTFIFMAENQLVASDGATETVLKAFEDNKQDYPFINPIIESDNRYMAGMDGNKLVVIDTRTLSVETYQKPYSVDFFVFTDEYLCFSYKDRIPASAYFNTLYTAKDGKVKLHGIIGEIDDHVLDGDTVIIKSQEAR